MRREGIRVFCLLLLWALLLPSGASVRAEEPAGPLTAEEIGAVTDQMKSLALVMSPLNDPAGEDALSEDGYAFEYVFGTLYADRTEMTEETGIAAAVVMDGVIPLPRGIALSMSTNALMACVPCGNPELAGSHDAALLYLEGAPERFSYGLVRRDGQRLQAVEYGVYDREAQLQLSLTCLMSGDGINAVRVDGLQRACDPEGAAFLWEELTALREVRTYRRVPVSENGADLTPFGEEDLSFLSLTYLSVKPEHFTGEVEDMIMEDGDSWLRRVDGDGYEALFRCDSEGRNAQLISFTLLSDELEGPRGVRLGDSFTEDFQRFRSGDGELDGDTMTELLYGDGVNPPCGIAWYGSSEFTLRYITSAPEGRTVELYLHYTDTVLDGIILHDL